MIWHNVNNILNIPTIDIATIEDVITFKQLMIISKTPSSCLSQKSLQKYNNPDNINNTIIAMPAVHKQKVKKNSTFNSSVDID